MDGTILNWILFAVGIALVIKGGDWFVDAASWIAKALHVPTFIIGATIVSIATTLPEIIVSVIAAAEGKTEMAIGNAVGSVTANTALILAIAMVAMEIVCTRKKHLTQIIMLIASASVLLVSSLSGKLSVPGSIVLAAIFVAFMLLNLFSARHEEEEASDLPHFNRKLMRRHVVMFIVGAAAIVGGSQLMVNYGSKIAYQIGVPERIIAVTLIAVGTSLPVLVTMITAIAKKESGLSIGNIIGANVIDLSLILPVCSLVSGERLPVSAQSINIDIPVCLAVTLAAMVPMMIRQKAHRLQGILLLAGYAVYIYFVVA